MKRKKLCNRNRKNERKKRVSLLLPAAKEEMMNIYRVKTSNHPASNYNLAYIAVGEILVGEYDQPVEETTYKVELQERNKTTINST